MQSFKSGLSGIPKHTLLGSDPLVASNNSISRRRVVITGLGAITNIGHTADSCWESICAGRSGIAPLTAFEQGDDWTVTIAGEIKDLSAAMDGVIDPSDAKRMDRMSVIALCAGAEAARNSGFDFTQGDPYSRGVAIGSGIGGVITMEEQFSKLLLQGPRKVSPFTVPKLMVNAAAGNLSIMLNLRGSNTATATACASGAHSIGAAYHLIERGDVEEVARTDRTARSWRQAPHVRRRHAPHGLARQPRHPRLSARRAHERRREPVKSVNVK